MRVLMKYGMYHVDGEKNVFMTEAAILATMFVAGLILGFVGAGGSGFIIALLTALFGIPVHTALGTAIAAMFFSSVSGAVSHYREGNVSLRAGIYAGVCASAGAWTGAWLSGFIAESALTNYSAAMLFLSGVTLWIRLFAPIRRAAGAASADADVAGAGSTGEGSTDAGSAGAGSADAGVSSAGAASVVPAPGSIRFVLYACGIGWVTGLLSGTFGIGSTPFIQVGLLAILGLSVSRASGTTMFIIVPIALSGAAGFYRMGYLDLHLLLYVVCGMMLGTYIGAKFTKRAPVPFLKTAMVALPMMSAAILFW